MQGKVKDWRTRTAVIVFDGILLFLFVNLILYVILALTQPPEVQRPWKKYSTDALLKAYPGWRAEDIKAMLTETWSKLPVEYQPFTAFKEKPFRGKFVNIDPAGFRISKNQRLGRLVRRPSMCLCLADRPHSDTGFPMTKPFPHTWGNAKCQADPGAAWRFTTLGGVPTSAPRR